MRRPPLLDLELAILIGLLLAAFVWCVAALYR